MPALRFVLGAIAALAAASAAAAKPPVWIVRDRDSEMLLFGSVHALPAGLDWRPAALDAAVKTADDLWFEFPAASPDPEAARRAAVAAQLPAGQHLSKLLPPPDAQRLKRLVARYGLDAAYVERLKPWMAELVVSQAVLGKTAGAYGDYSVESAVQALAPARVERRALETSTQQLALYQDPPMTAQVASFGRAMATLEKDPAAYKRVLDAWMSGDVRRLDQVAVEPERRADPAGFARMVTARTAAWVPKLDARLKGKGRTVVIVGVGHLVGPGGLPARLRALGYSVTGP